MNWTSFAVWNEDSFTFFYYTKERDVPNSPSIEIWVMDDYNIGQGDEGAWSWSKHLVIGPQAGLGSPLTFWKSDELLMRDED